MGEIQQLKNIFDSQNLHTSIEWLEACVTWCKEEELGPNYTFQKLKDLVYEQYCNTDLRDLGIPVLPPNILNMKHGVIKITCTLQIMEVVDISKPKYWQLQQIRKENVLTGPSKNELNESVGSAKRTLLLTLTDGVQSVYAMEYKPIPCLNINLTPGSKIRLLSPIEVRRGRLMLKQENVALLEGCVDDILVSNAAENVLARALNLPENPSPLKVDVNLLNINFEPEAQNVPNLRQNNNNRASNPSNNIKVHERMIKTSNINQSNLNIRNICDNFDLKTSDFPTDEELELIMSAENIKRKIPTKTDNKPKNKPDSFEDEMEVLREAERILENSRKKNERKQNDRKNSRTPDLFEDDLDVDKLNEVFEMNERKFEEALNSERNENLNKKLSQKNLKEPSTSKQTSRNNFFDDFKEEDFENLDFDNLDPIITHSTSKNPKSEIVTITNLLRNIEDGKLFKVKAKFKSVVEKLTLANNEYKLTIMVEDESNKIMCKVHTNVVSKWAGLTPEDVNNLKRNICSNNVESKKKVEKALQNIKDHLLEVNHVMEIKVEDKFAVPIITEIFY